MKERVKRLRKLLAERALSGMILRVSESGQSTQPNNQNVLYLSGFGGSTAVLLVTRKKCFIIADARYWSRAKLEAPDFRLVKVKRGEKFSNFINEALALAKLPESSKVGFEADRVPFSVAEEWKKKLSVKLEPVEMLVESLRQYKDALEIKYLKSACRKTCSVYREIEALVELALEIDSRLRQHGATDNSSQRAQLCHTSPCHRAEKAESRGAGCYGLWRCVCRRLLLRHHPNSLCAW